MENTPILLVPGFFLFVLIRKNNKKLMNSDGIRFIVSVFLMSLFLILISYHLTDYLKENSFISNYLIKLSNNEITRFEKIIQNVAIDVYINSFLISIVWWGLIKIDLLALVSKFISKEILTDFDRRVQNYVKHSMEFDFTGFKYVRFSGMIILTLAHLLFFRPACFILNFISQTLFLSDDSIHCKELELLINELVLITLKNDKVYIGRIESADINILANTDDILKVVPYFSGYRDLEKIVHLNTDYITETSEADNLDSLKEIFAINIFKREVISISKFDLEIGKNFIKKEILKSKLRSKSSLDDSNPSLQESLPYDTEKSYSS